MTTGNQPSDHVDKLLKLFYSRTDCYPRKTYAWDEKEGKLEKRYICVKEQLTTSFLLEHLTKSSEVKEGATNQIGAYSTSQDDCCKWFCYDADDHKGKDPEGCKKAAFKTYEELKTAGLNPHIEISQSGTGWHVWCFFDVPVKAHEIIDFCNTIVTTPPKELFPKQPTLRNPKTGKIGYGNLVALPYGAGTQSVFVDPITLKAIPLSDWLASNLYSNPEKIMVVAKAKQTTAKPQPPSRIDNPIVTDNIARAKAYIDKVPGAVSGQNGNSETYKTACKLVCDFALTSDEALSLLRIWNQKCSPPWMEADLAKIVENAVKYSKGIVGSKLTQPQLQPLPAPTDKQQEDDKLVFWYEEQKGARNLLKIDNLKLFEFLNHSGFCKVFPEGEDESILLRIQENITTEVTPEMIADFTHKYVTSLPEQITPNHTKDSLLGMLINPCYSFFSEKQLKKFLPTEITFHRDDKDSSFFYFKNGFVKATKSGKTFHGYKDLNGIIWKRWILQRDYKEIDDGQTGEIERFFSLLCNNDHKRLMALKTAVGYQLHRYKDPATTKAVIVVDEKISDEPEGGTGKSLVVVCISHIRNVAKVDGKDFTFDNRFAFQDVSWDTEIIAFDDVAKKFDFERLFHKITDGMEVERKGQHRFKIPREKSPKFIITTNYIIEAEGGSAERRKAEIEIFPHFNKKWTPREQFGHTLFEEWDATEWHRFDQFMVDCACEFLKNGLVPYTHVNLNERRVLQKTSNDFVQWANDYFKKGGTLDTTRFGHWISKKEIFDDFCSQFPDYNNQKTFSQHKFTSWIKTFAQHHDFAVTESRQRLKDKPERCFSFSISG